MRSRLQLDTLGAPERSTRSSPASPTLCNLGRETFACFINTPATQIAQAVRRIPEGDFDRRYGIPSRLSFLTQKLVGLVAYNGVRSSTSLRPNVRVSHPSCVVAVSTLTLGARARRSIRDHPIYP